MLLVLLVALCAQAETRVEIAVEGGFARVYEIDETPGRLPELVRVRSYPTLAEARLAAAQIASGDEIEKSLPVPLPTESGFLWAATQEWSWDWERRYAEWVEAEVDENFFQKHRIATDCADVAVALRWIFARMHGLPAAFHLMGSGQLFHQDVVNEAWRALPQAADWTEDKRFLKSLDYVLRLTYTHTLFRDSYPIEIKPATFMAGVHHLSIHDVSGHTQFIARVDASDEAEMPLVTIASTVPREVRVLYKGEFLVFNPPDRNRNALMRVRWPIKNALGAWELHAAEAHPAYSLQQFEPDFIVNGEGFADAVLKRINPKFDYLKRLNSLLNAIFDQLKARVKIVEDGYAACQRVDCSPGTEAYEQWSTPNRDMRIFETILAAQGLVDRQGASRPQIRARWEEVMQSTAVEVLSRSLKFKLLSFLWKQSWVETDPRATIADRWGLDFQGLAERVESRLNRWLAERHDSVQRAVQACLQGCPLGSPLWEQHHTAALDESIRESLDSARQYLELLPEDDHAVFKSELARRQFRAGPRQWSYDSLLENIHWFSLIPDNSETERWEGRSATFRTVRIPVQNGEVLTVSRGGVASIAPATDHFMPMPNPSSIPASQEWILSKQEGSAPRLLDLDTQQPIAPPAGKKWLLYSAHEDVGVAFGPSGTGFEIDFLNRAGALLFRDWVESVEELRFRWLSPNSLARGKSVPGKPPLTELTPRIDLYHVSAQSVRVQRSLPFFDPFDAPGFTKEAWVAPSGELYTLTPQGADAHAVSSWVDSDFRIPIQCLGELNSCVVLLIEKGATPMEMRFKLARVSLSTGTIEILSESKPISQESWTSTPHAPYLMRMKFAGGPPQITLYEWSTQGPLIERDAGTMYNGWLSNRDATVWPVRRPNGESTAWIFEKGNSPRQVGLQAAGGGYFNYNSKYATVYRPETRASFLHSLERSDFPKVAETLPGGNWTLMPAEGTQIVMQPSADPKVQLYLDTDFSLVTPVFSNSALHEKLMEIRVRSGTILRGKLGPSFAGAMIWYEKK